MARNNVSISSNSETTAISLFNNLRGDLEQYGLGLFGAFTEVSGLKQRLQGLIEKVYEYQDSLSSLKQYEFRRLVSPLSRLINIHTELEDCNTEFEDLAFEDHSLDAKILNVGRDMDEAAETLRKHQRHISELQIEVEVFELAIISLPHQHELLTSQRNNVIGQIAHIDDQMTQTSDKRYHASRYLNELKCCKEGVSDLKIELEEEKMLLEQQLVRTQEELLKVYDSVIYIKPSLYRNMLSTIPL